MNDLISRQAAIDALGDMVMNWTDSEYELGQLNQWKADRKAIIDLPSAQPEKRTEERTETHACDLIDRQEVLKLFPKYDYKHACFDLCNAIKDLPSAQPQWIPVTERLPEEWKRVLIQNDEGLFLVGFVKDRGWGKEWFYQYEMYDYDAYIESEQGKIVAWCELPDPWKGEQE